MKTTENNQTLFFQGAGYLIGALITMIIGISLFVLTENFVIALSSSLPIGTTFGILIEQRFQKVEDPIDSRRIKGLIAILLLGILTFFSILFL